MTVNVVCFFFFFNILRHFTKGICLLLHVVKITNERIIQGFKDCSLLFRYRVKQMLHDFHVIHVGTPTNESQRKEPKHFSGLHKT